MNLVPTPLFVSNLIEPRCMCMMRLAKYIPIPQFDELFLVEKKGSHICRWASFGKPPPESWTVTETQSLSICTLMEMLS